MNETLEKTLNEILAKSIKLAEQTGKFVIEQGGDLLEQFFVWHYSVHIMGIALGIILLSFAFIYPSIMGTKDVNSISNGRFSFLGKYFSDDSFGGVSSIIVFTFGLIIGLLVLLRHIYYMVYIIVAPKLYLIDYFIE